MSIGAIPEAEAHMFLQRYSCGLLYSLCCFHSLPWASDLLLTYLGQEIDRIEADIVREVPEVRYVDLELV
jgi:hypothetical protein